MKLKPWSADGDPHGDGDHMRLLHSFSQSSSFKLMPNTCPGDPHRGLWEADSSHRVNNLAQMCYSLRAPSVLNYFNLSDQLISVAVDSLAEAYRDLGVIHSHDEVLPVSDLLSAIANGLVNLFNGGRTIVLQERLAEVGLPALERRALILIASELIINCLKYAFLDVEDGVIELSLQRGKSGIILQIRDNGVGMANEVANGSGSNLINQLLAILGAKVERRSNSPGLEVTVVDARLVWQDGSASATP